MGRYRFHELDDLMALRKIVYQTMILDERLGYPSLAWDQRRRLGRIDRELRRRNRVAGPTS